ncbi:putative retrotransposon hot spot protein (RHS) [Trypanosoma cruzi]|uniref:Putative retrotransposon hot spot protein (RHS) n=1 Tax=Trypanosoma cruzi TaxID=5693 RepID=A0A2V2WB66_TRYCR|nr:putative retrotransposon hot spot protein (RHS) [Trypanosoma cruzi]
MPGNQAPAVPQGDSGRRARPESEGDTDQPAATQTRDEEAQRPQWTMSSSVKDILLEGSTLRNKMKLNEFIRNYFGGRGVVDTNENVSISVFVLRPTMFINDNEILGLITASSSYRELKIELDEREILLEAINRLHHEGVDFLGQWRDYQGKDTVTSAARRKLNEVLTQVLREARREAGERERQDQQQVIFNLYAVIEDVLFKGRVRVMEMKLSDFLTMEMEGKGILHANRNVLLRVFFIDPTRYIRDAGVLNEIRASGAYAEMEKTVRREMGLEEVVNKLYKNGVDNLLGWLVVAAEVKTGVHEVTKRFLDAAAEEARTQRSRVHRGTWRDCTSLCTMRVGAMRWNFRTAWSERKRGWR